jgi:hypothetical protein
MWAVYGLCCWFFKAATVDSKGKVLKVLKERYSGRGEIASMIDGNDDDLTVTIQFLHTNNLYDDDDLNRPCAVPRPLRSGKIRVPYSLPCLFDFRGRPPHTSFVMRCEKFSSSRHMIHSPKRITRRSTPPRLARPSLAP